MKKFFCLLAAILLIPVAAIGWTPPQSWMVPTAVLTADAAAYTGVGFIYGILAESDGTNDITVQLYDNTAASGTKLAPLWRIATTSDNRSHYISFDPPLRVGTGCYVDVTTAGTVNYAVYYRPQ